MSHSRELNRGSTVASKKSFRANVNGGPFVAKAPYNDVYGGPPEFGASSLSPRPEDYSEIFGSFHVSRASSIPILDLPELDEKEVFFDVQSSNFDYAEVFGGFDCLDFAATYEELTKQSNEGDGDSSEEAWTPAGTESLSDDSDHSSKLQCMFNGDSDPSFDCGTEFKISYNQAYQSGKEDMSNGMTHVTQVNEVPGFTYLVDGADFRGQDDENQPFHANDDGYFNIDLSTGLNENKPAKKKESQPPNAIYERQGHENGPQTAKGSDKSSSCVDESFITISEINLRTEPSQVPPPSRPPPIIGVKKLYSTLNSNSDYVFPEGISDDSSPPFFDVEVDASSSAAASAAAMKEVMEKARAKLLSVKEHMERKKEGVHNRSKQHFKYDMKDKEGSVSKLFERSNNGNDEKGQDTCEIVENEMTFSVTDEMRKVTQTNKEVQVSLKGEKLLKVAHKFAENKFKDDAIDDSRKKKEAGVLFEVKPDNSRKATELVKNENMSGRTVKTENDIVIEALEQLGENDNEVDAVLNVHGLKKTREAEGKNWQEDDNMRSKPATVLNSQREYERSEGTLCNYDLKEYEKKSEITHLSVEKKGSREADKPVKYEVLVEVKYNDNGGEVEQTITNANGKRKSQVINGRNDNDSKLKEISVVRENELGEMEVIQHVEMEGKLTESFDMSECEKRLKNIHGQNENERSTEDTLEKGLEDDLQEGNEAKPPKKPSEKEVGKRLKDDEEYENKLQDIHERWENILTKHKKHPKEKDCRKELEEINHREPSEMKIKEEGKQDKIEATADNASQYMEFVKMFEDHKGGELKKIKSADRAQVQSEMETSEVCNEVCEVDHEYQGMQQHCKPDQCRERVEATQGFLGHNESGDKMGEHKINKIQLDSTGMMHLESAEDINAFYRGKEVFIDLDWLVRPEDVDKSLSVDDSGNKDIDISSKIKYCDRETDPDVPPVAEDVKACGISYIFKVLENDQIQMKDEKNVLTQDESEKKGKEVGISNGHQHFVKMNSVPKVVSDPDHQDSKSDQALNLKGNKEKFVSTHVFKERAEKENKSEANESHVSGGKENTPNLASEVNAGQFIARKDKIMNDTLLVGDRETERMKKKPELENDPLKMEEEKEREREREKDRMIINKTILEGSKENKEGHAEKAAMEKAITEAQRKAMLEARERLEKACTEAREKSLSGKAALEARVRAERAAVERANAEARERAFEKAMAEKSVFESRERIERSFSDKLSASSRGTVIRQSSSFNDMPDLQFQRTDTSSGSRYTYSSSNGDVSEGVNVESAQRCKARLERHRRTAERAAKALAEKNMRDILAHREQVERNRLAETLDADVRRWSSGKEGNLRALLSTLQYILWPDSGWQPVPLTEVITAAAVKKAYRKATLCVHPDKLQQRGASIQQKYICEKVFDLLKEAWNKFNSEER